MFGLGSLPATEGDAEPVDLLQRSFDDLGAPLAAVPFCVFDVETTGGSPTTDSLTEIGAVKYLGGEVIGEFQTLINPGREIPPFITILTGITHAMVVEAPRVETVLPSFLEFIGESVLVGHNVRFDIGFLNAAALQCGYSRVTNRSIDTLGLARRLVRNEIRNLKLESLAAHFRSPVKPTHRALEDARATGHVLHALLERAGTLGVTALEDLLQLPTARGSTNYPKMRLADELPRRPGVYLFKDRQDNVIYVGKAKNLRTRVRSYFYGDTRRSIANLLNELDSIEGRVCETELEASITELRLIHTFRPRHNRRSKPPKASHWVKLTKEEFPRLSLVRTLRDDGLAYLGPFRSRKAAELVMTAIWDAVPIRRCLTKPGSRSAACAFAQLGVARCPCDGSLTADEYGNVIRQFMSALNGDPALLLTPIRHKMVDLAASQRYEEAGWMRDRYRALARAMDRRFAWQSMLSAGAIRAEHGHEGAFIEDGRFVMGWLVPHQPLLPVDVESPSRTVADSVPPSVLAAEEAHLIWSWLSQFDTAIIHTSHPFHRPAQVPELAA
ncbi:MAG: DEDD exonuclease domain-containing protein [Acidimicrobiia bacterium]|nr:DEDD exonuclease domain-containing protein [Acidimicrobiia bacterium]